MENLNLRQQAALIKLGYYGPKTIWDVANWLSSVKKIFISAEYCAPDTNKFRLRIDNYNKGVDLEIMIRKCPIQEEESVMKPELIKQLNF